jgi:hypothetical protein
MERSREEQIKQKISQESCQQRRAVNTLRAEEALKSEPARTTKTIHEAKQDRLMEQVTSKDNLVKALRRVELNKGAPGIDGIKVEEL